MLEKILAVSYTHLNTRILARKGVKQEKPGADQKQMVFQKKQKKQMVFRKSKRKQKKLILSMIPVSYTHLDWRSHKE